MPRTNLDDLNAFLAVAKERSFTRAAAKLGVSQSALSLIRFVGLNLDWDLRLLTRTTRSVSPTETGERLLRSIGPRLDEIDAELEAISALRDKPIGTIRLTAGEHSARSILWPRLSKVLPRYPDIRVEVIVDYGLTDIVAERYDAGVRLGQQIAKDMIAVRIGSGHEDGSRWLSVLLCEAAKADEASGPHKTYLHQFATSDVRQRVCMGI